MCYVMEEYTRDIVQEAVQKTERNTKRSTWDAATIALAASLRKKNPHLTADEATKQAREMLGLSASHN